MEDEALIEVALFSNQFADAAGHGLARYARELHGALSDVEGIDAFPVAAWSSLPRADLDRLRRDSGLRLTGLGRRLTPLLWTWADAPPVERLVREKVDVVHALSLGYPVATRRPFVVTVHDLGPLTHPQYFTNTRPWVMERSLAQADRRADVIVCVSQSTADEVCGLLGDGVADRIRVMHEGVSEEFFAPPDLDLLDGLALLPADAPFILSAGKRSPRKNVHGVLKAMSEIVKSVPHHLVLVGGAGWDTDAVDAALDDPTLRARVHFLDFVSDALLRALYAKAALYVHPSLYEGFGLTVLEAMASGTPVIASDVTSLPEVAGSAGRLVDPTDVGELAAAMLQICTDAALAEDMARRGRAHAAGFRWSDSARATAAIYRDLSARGGGS